MKKPVKLLLMRLIPCMVAIICYFSGFSQFAENSFASGIDFPTDTGAVGIAVGDINGDGKLDIVTTNYAMHQGNSISVYENKTSIGKILYKDFSSSFELSTGMAPNRLALGDLTGDGLRKLSLQITMVSLLLYMNILEMGVMNYPQLILRASLLIMLPILQVWLLKI